MCDAVRNFLKFSLIKIKNPTLAEGARMGHPTSPKPRRLNSLRKKDLVLSF
jgi:hypothetical protein